MPAEATIVNVADVTAVEESIGRSGRIVAKTFPLDTGRLGVRMDFTWTFLSKDYGTPRHRHNFDQIRYVLDGEFSAGTGEINAGQCAYFPEGVYYGPQHQDADCLALILQFPGPSGAPYCTHQELDAARRELIAAGGRFKDGVYTRDLPDGHRYNKDSHAACYEHLTGRALEFPEGRFRQPVIMLPEAYRWRPDARFAGVERKHLGTFAENRTGLGLVRLLPGTRIPAAVQDDAEIRYVLEGSIRYDGKTWQGGKTRDHGTYMFIQSGGQVKEISTDTGCLYLSIALPMLGEAMAEQRAPHEAVA
ncbi:MAG TPA: hypothetical protein VL993_17705 [Stellaceae bacterium]|nr:hypothetical protein [Stellaceae bacterium]